MKHCRKCGTNAPDAAAICSTCGTRFTAPSAGTKRLPLAETPGFKLVKSLTFSPVLIVALLAFTTAFVIDLISAINGAGVFLELLSVASALISNADVLAVFDIVRPVYVGIQIVQLLPPFLILIGMWVTFGYSAKKSGTRIPTAGLSLIKGVVVYRLIMFCIFVALCLLVLIVPVTSFYAYYGINGTNLGYYNSYLVPFLVVTGILFLAITTMVILYYANVMMTINTMRRTMKTGKSSARVSVYVAVINILLGLLFAVGGVLTLDLSVISAVSAFAQAIASIAFGIFLFQYKHKMTVLNAPSRKAFDAVPPEK